MPLTPGQSFLDCGLNFIFYQHGSDLGMIFSVNASTVLHFFHFNISLSTCLMILLVSKDLLLFVNLSPFMYILEGMRPTSTMVIFSHLKLQQNGVCMLDDVAACRSPWAGNAAAIREVSSGAKSHPGHTKGNL